MVCLTYVRLEFRGCMACHYLFNYDYNRLYDLYHMAGLKASQMRVASPFNDYSKDSLNLYRVLDPEIWAKLVGRVQGRILPAYMPGQRLWGTAALPFRRGIHGNPIPGFCWIRFRSG